MQIQLFNFSKRSNSTAQPNFSTATTIDCQLKDETSFLAPSIVVRPNLITGFSPSAFNYAHIAYWQRYYYIKDWVYKNGVWECQLVVDALASFKTQIGNMSEYILRSSYEKDGNIIDTMYVTKTEPTTILTLLDEVYIRAYTGGFFILGVIGNPGTAAQGAVTYYQMTAGQIASMIQYMLSTNFLTAEAQNVEFTHNCLKLFFNSIQYISSCTWYPFAMSEIPSEFKTATSNVQFGWWGMAFAGDVYRLNTNVPLIEKQMVKEFPTHPQISRGNFVNHSPFTQTTLHFSPFGDIEIPNQTVQSGDKLELDFDVDPLTGIGILSIYILNSSNIRESMIARLTQKIGVDIQIAQIASDVLGQVATVNRAAYQWTSTENNNLSAAVSSVLNLNIGGAAQAGMSIGAEEGLFDIIKQTTLADVMKTGTPQITTSGHNGTMADYKQPNYLQTTFYIIADNDNSQHGSPLCKIRTIKNIPGFIVAMNPDIRLNATESEKAVIGQEMAAGFFYE